GARPCTMQQTIRRLFSWPDDNTKSRKFACIRQCSTIAGLELRGNDANESPCRKSSRPAAKVLAKASSLFPRTKTPCLLRATSSRGSSSGGERGRLFTSSNGRYLQRGGMCLRI